MKAVTALMAVAALLQPATSHVMGLGKCKSVPAMQTFDPDRFAGLWYVIEIFSTSSECMTMTFNRTATGFNVTEAREFYLGNMINLDHTFSNTGYMTVPNPSEPAKMKVRWPSNFFGPADVTIVDTDYTSFAVIFECQPLIIINRASAAILSRNNTLDVAVIERIKEDLSKSGLDMDDFDVINHRSCKKVGEADFNWSIDGETFPSLGRGKVVNKTEGFENVEDIPDIKIPTEVEFLDEDPTQNEVVRAE